MIQRWPTPSETAETLLVRRDGDDVLFLNDLRFQDSAALNLRIPLARSNLPAARAIQGEEGIFEGVDYQEVPVLADIRAVPDSPWFMVARMNLKEIYAPLRERMWWTIIFVFGLLVLVGAVVGAMWQRNVKTHYREINAAEARYRTTLNSIGDGVIVTDPEGRIQLMNPSTERLTGWSQSLASGEPLENVFRIINEDTRQPVETPVKRVLAEGTVIGLANHTVLMSRDGREIPIADSGAPVLSEAGEIAGVVLVFSDQTEHREAERVLKEREAKYRGLFNSIRDAILVADTNRIIIDCNPAFTELFGYSLDEIAGEPTSVIYESEAEFVRMGSQLKENMANPNFLQTVRYRSREGRSFPGETNVFNLKDSDGKVVGFIGLIRDVTEREERERELKRIAWMLQPETREPDPDIPRQGVGLPSYGNLTSLATSRRILDAVGVETLEEIVREYLDMLDTSAAVYEANGDYAVGIFSSGWCRIMDEGSRRLCGTADNREALQSGKWLCHESCWTNASRQSIETGKPVDEACEGGLRLYAVPIFAGGEIVGSTNIGYGDPPRDREKLAELAQKYNLPLQDLIEQAEAYESRPAFVIDLAKRRLEASARLIGEMVERHRMQKQREELQEQLVQSQKMESVGRLAGGVAHDFNNMLSVIIGNVELATHRVSEGDPLRDFLDAIYKSAHRSAGLTRQLLAFARKQTIAPKVLDLNETLTGMLDMLRRLIGENIELEWCPCKGPWPIKMDPTQIDQILANLCVNARDAISGTGKVIIETGNKVVDREYCVHHEGFFPGDFVTLTVSDNGCGIHHEEIVHLFEPFYTTKGVGKGTGLGLATVYGIVKQNGGFINVYSEPGKGSTFRIYLPRFGGSDETAATGEKPEIVRGTETVLVVEDETTILKMAVMMLEELGYTVLSAGTIAEALRTVQEFPGEIDLLLSDVIMPEMNGRELAGKLKESRPRLKSLFMSGYTANVVAHHGVLDEGVNFMEKPFTMNILSQCVRQTLDT